MEKKALENFTELDVFACIAMLGFLVGDWNNAVKHGWENIARDSYEGARFMVEEKHKNEYENKPVEEVKLKEVQPIILTGSSPEIKKG